MNPALYFSAAFFDGSETNTPYPAVWVAVFLLVILPMLMRKKEEAAIIKLINRRKNLKEKTLMNELAMAFVGKDCLIYLFNGSQYTGIIKEVSSGAVLVEKNGVNEVINLDFVSRIREYPVKKNGKKKSVVID